MKRTSLLALTCGILFWGCGPSNQGPDTRSLLVSASQGALTTAAPARVSVAFTVDTSDGKPVSNLPSASFDIQEDDQPVSSYESQASIQPKGSKARIYSLLLLDLSGSILKSGDFPALQQAAKTYVDAVLARKDDGYRVAVAGFDGRVALIPVSDFTDNATALKAAIDNLSTVQCSTSNDCAAFTDHRTCAGWMCVDESTNLYGAVVQGLAQLKTVLGTENDVVYKDASLLLFTDGTDQAARVSLQDARNAIATQKLHVFAVGLGGEVDPSILGQLATDGYKPVSKADDLEASFKEMADKVTALANHFYVLDYCSPKRSGQHSLTLTAHWTDPSNGTALTGSLTRTFNADGFASGCDLSATPTP